jgi:hypothetical protein
MKPVPRSYGVSGELKPVKPNSYGVVNTVSVLVSVADPASPMSLLLSQLRLEAEVGIEPANHLREAILQIRKLRERRNPMPPVMRRLQNDPAG